MIATEEFVAEDLLESAVQFSNSRQFRDVIDQFVEDNVHYFYGTADSKSIESSEMPHEYNLLFAQYQQIVDDLFETLAREKGFTTKALYRCFRDSGKHHHFILSFHLIAPKG